MKIIFLTLITILLFSCDSKSEKSSAKNDSAVVFEDGTAVYKVESIPESLEEAVQSIKERSETSEVLDEVIDAFVPSPFIAKILEQLGIQPKQVYEEFIVQKVLPYDTKSTVVVIPTVASQEYDWEVFVLNSYILVVDAKTAIIKKRFYEKESWYSDAVRIEEISIDTANYKVADGKRAFGIRLRYIGASRPNPYSSITLSLFIPDDNKLVRVLDAFEINSYWGEWDMRCTGEFTSVGKILLMDTHQHNGFYDIKVGVETTTMDTFEKGEDDCDEKETTKKSKQLLRYYGSYQLYNKTYALETVSSCGLEIRLEGDQYHLKTGNREHAGTFEVRDGYITFKGLLGDDLKREVQGTYSENEIVIQNYGNAMNPFTIFEECGGQKYLKLVIQE